jgi:uncharacterized protein YcfL
MKKFIAILGLAAVPVLSPLTGQAQQSENAVSYSSHFMTDKLSTREDQSSTYVDGVIRNNVTKEPVTVYVSVQWYDKDGKVIAESTVRVGNLAPGESLPFEASTSKNPETKSYGISVKGASS